MLGRYVRELGLMSLPEAIRRMTGFSAERMGLRDRGRLAEGLAADLVARPRLPLEEAIGVVPRSFEEGLRLKIERGWA